jgi:hypothetical protein
MNNTQSIKTNDTNYLVAYTVREYGQGRNTKEAWTRIGAAFPHKEGIGFTLQLDCFPRDGRVIILPPQEKEETEAKAEEATA